MKVESPAFADHQPIPAKYTCQGEDLSPPLSFFDLPPGTVTLAIIIDDPDAPGGTFDHWVAWNISPELGLLREGGSVPNEGKNHYNQVKYRGPCPPPGKTHRYFIKVYALNARLDLQSGATKGELEKAMAPHILGQAQLIGTYKKR